MQELQNLTYEIVPDVCKFVLAKKGVGEIQMCPENNAIRFLNFRAAVHNNFLLMYPQKRKMKKYA
jgi:hypothetical protein